MIQHLNLFAQLSRGLYPCVCVCLACILHVTRTHARSAAARISVPTCDFTRRWAPKPSHPHARTLSRAFSISAHTHEHMNACCVSPSPCISYADQERGGHILNVILWADQINHSYNCYTSCIIFFFFSRKKVSVCNMNLRFCWSHNHFFQ